MSIEPAIAERVGAEEAPLLLPCFDNLPHHVRESFTPDQREALNGWAHRRVWTDHPVNIRLSVPSLFSRYYLVIVGGRERRSAERRETERKIHPLSTWANWFFIAGTIGMAFYFFALLVASLFTWHFMG